MGCPSDSNEIVIMRVMAWERAKGELQSILAGFYNQPTLHEIDFKAIVSEFIDKIENEGYLE